MTCWPYRHRMGIAAIAAVSLVLGVVAPVAQATAGQAGGGVPPVRMFGYAQGPGQRFGTAAGKPHEMPASATRARDAGGMKGHVAPKLPAAPAPFGTRAVVRVGAAVMPPGHLVTGSPSGTDNASYSVASVFDTVPMANQSGRIAVTVTNTGTSTWSGYALGTQVFPAGDTTGTGTPLTTGPAVTITGSVAPNGTATVESVTPAEVPGSYEICWDMVNASGTYFAAEGGNQYCAPYTIQQYPAQVTEQSPLPGSDVNTQSPLLAATATVPGGYPATPVFTFAFRILNGPNPATATVLQSSGWVSGNSNDWTPGTALSWGSTYYWQVTVTDAATPPSLSSVTWTTPISFTVGDAQPGVSGQFGPVYQADDGNPVMTSDLGGSDYSGSGKTVDPRTGNLSQQVTDAKVATAGPALEITRTYNSLDPRTSQALGAGWSSLLDMSLAPDSDGTGALILTLADGQQVRFAKNAAGGYAPPQNFYAVISPVSGGGFTVTDQAATTWSFTQASGSSWLLAKETDASGKAATFGYSSGALTTITSAVSGRALHLTWSTPSGAAHPHVASVSTDPVTAGNPATALTWNYGYSGDLLSSVCPPGTTTACTSYQYASGASHAAPSVMNTNPGAYYRLNDVSGAAAAANLMPVDELTTLDPPATEMNTTPGVAGPISGVTATGFDGSSSWIPLDGMWCDSGSEFSCGWVPASGRVLNGNGLTSGSTTLNDLAISVWFQTTAKSGVLAGISGDIAGGPPCLQTNSNGQCIKEPDAVPLLWVDANGHLDGLNGISTTSLNTSATTAMTSAGAVNNGSWHQAVVIPGRALYLDGKQIATGSGQTLTLPGPPQGVTAPDVAMLGTGLSKLCSGCNPPQWQYFKGSMAEAAVWQNQIPGPDAIAAQYAAETTPAAELTGITSPAGRTQLSASYDTTSDRVAALTDAKGGSWTYSNPVNTSTAGAYDSAVMADSPQDFWPLSDAAGPLAANLVGSAPTAASPRPPASYSGVTLGQAGPMTDQSAAGFGTGSKVSVASQDFSTASRVSVETWFNTTASGQEFLLNGASGASSGDPLTLEVKGGCLEALLQDDPLHIAKQSTCGTSSNFVDDGFWHQAAATLGPPSAPSNGKVTQTLTLYQDGQQIGSVQVSTSPTASSGTITSIGAGFGGSIADVSVYPSMLDSAQITGHYVALASQQGTTDPNGGPLLPPVNTQTVTVRNPLGGSGRFVYAMGALVEAISPTGGITRYGYDASMRADTITDPDGDTTYTVHDTHNNVISTTTCAAVNTCQTVYTSYYENLSNPLDPRNDKPTDSRDPRSSSPSDPAYDTVTAYTATAQVASTSTPPTLACPSGCTTSYAYTTGTEAAAGGGTEPAGLVKSATFPGGGVTSYTYDAAGDVAQVTDPLGLITKYGYDNLGRQLSQTQVSDTYPNGLTTSFSYDGQGRVITQTDPEVTDRVTGAQHTKVTSYTYDADGNVLTTTESDATGGDPSRTITDTYDTHGGLATTKDALGNVTSYGYDGLGDKTGVTNPAGMTTAYAYDAAGRLVTVTLDGYTGNPSAPIPAENLVEQSRAYDPAGRIASVTDVRGTTTNYTYYGNNKLATSYVVCSSCANGQEQVHSYSYDAAGNAVTQAAPGGLVVNTAFDADSKTISQTMDPSGVNRAVTVSYDQQGNVVSESLAGGGTTQTVTMTYNTMGQVLSKTVDNTGGLNLTTTYRRDQRGLVTAETDPAGNITTIQNDEAGQAVVITAPAVSTQNGTGSAPVTASPVTMTGYNTFGEVAEKSDADGNVTTYAYDQDGQQTTVTDPSYTPPGASGPVGGTTTTSYNNLGLETSQTDPLGNKTAFTYDQLGDKATQTDPGGGTWVYTYDPAAEQTSVTDPTGAQTQATYSGLGQLVTTTDMVRQNTSAAYTTSYGYDDAGNRISQTSPTGAITKTAYDAVGEKISTTDGAGNVTGYAYNLDGEPIKETMPDGTAVTIAYDLAGRELSRSSLDASGAVLRTESAVYNPDGKVTSATDPRGDTMSYSYDATGHLTSATQPVSASQSITVGYGYDLAGHRTALTDGNGNTTYTTYNSRGLPETITEPATAQHSSPADSQTINGYDANGNLVSQTLPGGIQISSSYDANGNLSGQSGTGASAPTAARAFTYDQAGRMLTAATAPAGVQGSFGYQPATSETFSWDDRGLMLSATGTAGTTSYSYNGTGQPTAVTDAAGTTSYAYDSAGRLSSDTDPAAGVTGSYSYNGLDQVTQISYGTGNDTQSFGYDTLHRLTSDSITTPSGATVASLGYGYDANNNITSMSTTGLANPYRAATVTNTYGYDQANRLTSWTATPSGGTAATKTYGYDNNGNLTSDNGAAQTYDTRNELVADASGNTYTYSAAGNLAQETGAGSTVSGFTTDAYGQQITDASSSYAWDALNRVVSVGQSGNASYNVTVSYEGQTRSVTSDSSATYSHDPDGQITGVNGTAGKTLALVDAHNDLSGTLAPAGTTMTTTATWDPWGQPLASSGPALQVGYQGQWTDPATGQVNMGSRMYQPSTSGFINQDTYTGGEGGTAVTDNLHAYANDDPITFTDPTGHMIPVGDSSGTPTVTPADLSADRARIAAANKAAARLSSDAAKASQAAARFEKAAQSFAALARKLNSQAAQLEAAASVAAAAAASAYQAAQAALHAAQAAQARASAEQAAADRDQSLVTVYTIMNPQPQTAAAFQRQANAENAAAAADRYAAAMLFFAYDGLMALYTMELSLEIQLRFEAAIDKIAAAIAGVFAIVDAAAAAALRATARALSAAAEAAKRQAAAAVAKYNADLRAYQAQKQRAAKRKPNLAAFRHTLHCLLDPAALLTPGCEQVYKQSLATQKLIAKCDKNGATAKDCEQIWKIEEEISIEETPCNGENYGTCNPQLSSGGGGSILGDILRYGLEAVLEIICDGVTEGACTAANLAQFGNYIIDLAHAGG